ncbi:hypothetical protein CLOSBL3_11469 [Clostridiaceae bacterium BL-3]|nr:hypothetical protein CLOSBL3_11469 [Clostridiaceae bacterium BL-3]
MSKLVYEIGEIFSRYLQEQKQINMENLYTLEYNGYYKIIDFN